MKYEMLFGDKDLADKFTNDRSVFIVERDGVYFEFEDGSAEGINYLANFCTIGDRYYMRRIIEEPKRWTVADQKAGKLPEVGCNVFDEKNENEVVVRAINTRQVCLESPDGFIYLLPPDDIKPIETTEEKAKRLREEWCIKALSSCSILSGMQKYELKRLGGYIEDIYDALLSGDLPVPSKE